MKDKQTEIPDVAPVTASPASGTAVDQATGADLPKVSRRWIALTITAAFGIQLALVAPIAISLSIQLNKIAPGREEYLGYLLSVGAISGLLLGPIVGQLSDRTRTAIGRRRPWIIGGIVLALIGLLIMGVSTSVALLGVGWAITQIGFVQAGNLNVAMQADKLPESQRGKVAGLFGVATMAAPVFGAVIAGPLAGQSLALFLVPGAIALVLTIPLLVFARESDSRSLTFAQPLSTKRVLAKYAFNPRKYPDYSWNWLARFVFFFGLTLSTTYTAFFFAARLNITLVEVSGLIGIIGLLGVVATMGGAFASGFLSDKIKRRKPFVVGGGILFAVGAIVTAFAPDLPILIIGSVICQMSIGIFSAVDQALMLDVLPERTTDAARFINISQFSIGLPQAIAPVVASLLLGIGVIASGDKNYVLLYFAAAALTIIGGLLVLRVKAVH